jgi:hypothetical protein
MRKKLEFLKQLKDKLKIPKRAARPKRPPDYNQYQKEHMQMKASLRKDEEELLTDFRERELGPGGPEFTMLRCDICNRGFFIVKDQPATLCSHLIDIFKLREP